MSEPTLEGIEDYNTLKGEKKTVVIGVIFVGLILGVIYSIAYSVFDNSDDTVKIEKSLNKIPMK